MTSTFDAPDPVSNDGDPIPDWVQDMAEEFEDTHARQTGAAPAGLGWREPVSDGTRGEPAAAAVARTSTSRSWPGPACSGSPTTDAGQGAGPTQHAYIVMDNDYAESPDPVETLQTPPRTSTTTCSSTPTT